MLIILLHPHPCIHSVRIHGCSAATPRPHPSHRYGTFVHWDEITLELTTQPIFVLYPGIITAYFKKTKTDVTLKTSNKSADLT